MLRIEGGIEVSKIAHSLTFNFHRRFLRSAESVSENCGQSFGQYEPVGNVSNVSAAPQHTQRMRCHHKSIHNRHCEIGVLN